MSGKEWIRAPFTSETSALSSAQEDKLLEAKTKKNKNWGLKTLFADNSVPSIWISYGRMPTTGRSSSEDLVVAKTTQDVENTDGHGSSLRSPRVWETGSGVTQGGFSFEAPVMCGIVALGFCYASDDNRVVMWCGLSDWSIRNTTKRLETPALECRTQNNQW